MMNGIGGGLPPIKKHPMFQQLGQMGQPATDPAAVRRQQIAAHNAEEGPRVMRHEAAHQAGAGHFAGAAQLDYNNEGVIVGGHVPITMPKLDPGNPAKSYQEGQMVFAGATAVGGEMSAADQSVANAAAKFMGQAKLLMDQKALQQKRQGGPGGC